jgi:S1-C subfamily serine protease
MGEGTSVTRGIISAAERQVLLPDRATPLMVLQTDAAINYGSSGGPLINTRGEIVGINLNQATGLIVGSSRSEGMGYSISSNVAAPVLEEIVANYRTPAIGIIGVSLADDERNRAAYWGIPPLGVLVIDVQPGRAAHRADIRPDDVITSFDGQPIFDMPQLQAAVRAREIGDIAELQILRGGSFALTVEVEIAIMYRESF